MEKIGLDWMILTRVEADRPAGFNVGMTDQRGLAGAADHIIGDDDNLIG